MCRLLSQLRFCGAGRHLCQPVANDRLRHMLIGYARVSKADGSQSLDLQRDALRADGVDAGHVYHDVASGAGARAMTDSPTRVAAQRWHHWVPGAAVALMAAAATLLPGLAVAQDIYLRAGLDLSRPADTHFTDADCASLVQAALYGCGVGGDGAPLRSVGDFGTVAGVELGLGYAVASSRAAGGPSDLPAAIYVRWSRQLLGPRP